MKHSTGWARVSLELCALAFAAAPALAAQSGPVTVGGFPSQTLRIIVPASAGGGWDGTARAIQEVLREDKIAAKPVDVVNVTGGGGTVGLARLINQYKNDGHTVMVMGLSLVGSIYTNKSPVDLSTTTPLARLTADYQAVAVPNNSKYTSLRQLLDDFRKNSKSVVWGGGPGGGPDHLTVGFIAKAMGIAPKDINYVAFSGGELRPQIMGGQVTAAVTSFSELKADAEAKQLRILAITAPKRLPGSSIPTAKESGLDLVFANWRGVVGPPGMKDNERKAWIEMLTRVRNSPRWKNILKTRDWLDDFEAGDDFAKFVKTDSERVGALERELGLAK